jgi:hypothetical protein
MIRGCTALANVRMRKAAADAAAARMPDKVGYGVQVK